MTKRENTIKLYNNLIEITKQALIKAGKEDQPPGTILSIENDLSIFSTIAQAEKEQMIEDMAGNHGFSERTWEEKASNNYYRKIDSWIASRLSQNLQALGLVHLVNPDWTYSSGFDQGGSY